MKWLAAAILTMGSAPAEPATVWVFLSPDSPDATRIFEALRGERVRPALLVERYLGAREPAEAFLSTLKVSGELRVLDEEALREAKRWRIRRLPAVAVVRGSHAHVGSGADLDVKELLRCSK